MRLLLAATLGLSVAGCSTIGDMASGEDGQRLYGGTRKNVALVEGSEGYTHGGVGGFLLGVFDFPFSFALDTAFLPVTLVFAIARSGQPRLTTPPPPRSRED